MMNSPGASFVLQLLQRRLAQLGPDVFFGLLAIGGIDGADFFVAAAA